MSRTRRILFATDFSTASRTACREAFLLAKKGRAELLIAHVLQLPIPFSPDGFPLPRTTDELAAAARREAGQSLESLLKEARRAHLSATGVLLTGRPEQAIARAAKKHRVDLLVVGTHGRSGLPRLILGSVAARITAASPCPVLAVPQRYRRSPRRGDPR
jgi:nucleotide-binding universal stress UspA family protein